MKKVNRGIGIKIFAGFITLILVGLVIGGAGHISLTRVTGAGELEELAKDIQIQVLEARRYEKNFLMRKDKESFDNLMKTFGRLEELTGKLRSVAGKSDDAEEIRKAKEAYAQAASEMKRLVENDAALIDELKGVAKNIASIATEEAAGEATRTKGAIVQANAANLKENALKNVRNVVDTGYSVLKHYQEASFGKEAALATIRNLHFEGGNYLFVLQEDLIMVAHGDDRKFEGTDFGELQDKKTGKAFMKKAVENALRNGDSYTEYSWVKPGKGEELFPKITYVKHFKPWGLIIGAGIYVDDMEREIAKTETLLTDGLKRFQQANDINDLIQQARFYAAYFFAFEQGAEEVGKYLQQLKQLEIATDALKKEADTYQEKFSQCVANHDKRGAQDKRIVDMARSVLKVSGDIEKEATQAFRQNASLGKTLILSFIAVGAVLGLALATLLTRGIAKPVKQAITGLDEASHQVTAASSQISSTSQQLAEGTSQQAASLEETSSSLEEMASMTRQNAQNAGHADSLVKSSAGNIYEAKEAMTELTESMQEISKASEDTQKIIKTIDEIAFQTNLLALNAAVEAARAGEAGSGFAVVADEVRNLALRAAEAARNTAGIIDGTVKRIKEGSDLAAKAGGAFVKVEESAGKVGELVGEIAAASNEQAQGIEQINKAIFEMDKVVQHNASSAEESAAASEELNAQASQMQEFVSGLGVLISGNHHNGNGKAIHMDAGAPEPLRHGRSAGSLPKKLNGKRCNAVAPRAGAIEVRPDRLIPMDDGCSEVL